MDGSNSISHLNAGAFAEHAAQASGFNMDAIQKELKGDKKLKDQKEASKLLPENEKPGSVSLLDQKGTPQDLLERFAKKMAQGQSGSIQGQLQESIKDQLQDVLTDSLKHLKAQDTVSIGSKVGASMLKDDFKTKKSEDSISLDDWRAILGEQKKEAAITLEKTALQDKNPNTPKEQTAQIQDTLKKYISAYSETLIKDSSQKKQEVQELRKKLQEFNVPVAVLKQAEANVEKMVRKDLRKELKDKFIEFALAYKNSDMTPELMQSSKMFTQMETIAKEQGAISDDKSDLDDIKRQAKEDIQSFITQELDSSLVQKRLETSSTKELIKAFNQFNELAGIAHFDANGYMKSFQEKMHNLGLTHFVNPNAKPPMDTDSQDSQKKKDQKVEFADEDAENLTDKLRQLFMQKAIHRDLKNAARIHLSIQNIYRKLKKSGKFDSTAIDALKEEGESIAKFKLTELVKESLEERAVLPELKGPEYQLSQTKLKKALSGLKALGTKMPRSELLSIRDNINRSMFSIVKEEYLKLRVSLEIAPKNIKLLQQVKQYRTILERLKTETKIIEDIEPKQFQERDLLSSKVPRIIEAA